MFGCEVLKKDNTIKKRHSARKFSISPISLIVWVWLFFVSGFLTAISYFVAIVLHELGHFVVAKILGYKLSKFSLSPYGVELAYSVQSMENRDQTLIALAGPLVNLVSAFLVLGLWWLFPMSYFFTYAFVEISVILALFNLLPAFPMDGGRVFVGVCSHFTTEKIAQKITIIFNCVLSVLFLLLFVVFCFINFNPTYLLFAFFLIAGMLDLHFVTRFEKINIFCKKTKNFSKMNVIYVKGETKICELLKRIQTSKTHLFCLVLDSGRVVQISEALAVRLSTQFSYDSTLAEIFKK